MRPLRYLDVCTGYATPHIGWRGLPLECVGVAEVDPAPCAVLAHRLGAGRPRCMPRPEDVVFPEGFDSHDEELFKRLSKLTGAVEPDDEEGNPPPEETPEQAAQRHFVLAWRQRQQRAAAIKALDQIAWGDRIPNYGDFTTIGGIEDVGPIDALWGGTPCQDFSIAGKRAGIDAPRGNLTLEFLALAKRLRPRWLGWENVPGFLSIDGGRAMGAFQRIMGELGYGWAWRILDAQYARVDGYEGAVPQRRRRLFFVGYLGAGAPARAVLFDSESLRWRPRPRRAAGQGATQSITTRFGSSGVDFPDAEAGWVIPVKDGEPVTRGLGVSHTLRGEGFDAAEDGTGRGTPLVPIPILEPGRRTGSSTDDPRAGMGVGDEGDPMYTLNSGPPHGVAVPADVSPALLAQGNSTGGDRPPGTTVDTAESLIPIHVPEVCPQAVSAKWAKGSSGPAGDEVANLVAFGLKDHGNRPNSGGQVGIAFSIMPMNSGKDFKVRETDVAQPIMSGPQVRGNQGGDLVVAFDPNQITHPLNKSDPQPGDPSHTLPASGHPPSIAYGIRSDASRAGEAKTPSADAEGIVRLRDPGLGISENLAPTLDSGSPHSVAHQSRGVYRVRRLTPRECERLQGLPDDWTLVPYRNGKPMADGPRYKMIGNGQAGNVVRWIGQGIVDVEAILQAEGLA